MNFQSSVAAAAAGGMIAPSQKNSTPSQSHRNQPSVHSRRNDERRTFEAASPGNRTGHAAIAERSGSVDRGIEKHAICVRFGGWAQQHQLANVCTTAGCEDGATLEYALTGLVVAEKAYRPLLKFSKT